MLQGKDIYTVHAWFKHNATEGLVRGQEVVDTDQPIAIPVGPETLGRIMNVIGEPVDEGGPVDSNEVRSIHQPAPEFARPPVPQPGFYERALREHGVPKFRGDVAQRRRV